MTFYIPGTTTPKDTWQNSSQSILNANPVTLDAAGRAIIYGSGAYRQVVKDQFGNLIWDQDTAEPNQGAVSFGGTSGGTANAQTLSAAQFSGMDGQIISFVAGITNTGPMTISVGGASPIPVLKNSPSGPVALAAGDIVSGNSYFIQYSSALSAFQLLLSVAPSIPSGLFLQGYLFGLVMTNNASDPANDIDIGIGSAASDGVTPFLMSLASALTKRVDAPWAVGNNQGGLDTGSVGNSTYYIWLIQRSDTGVVDALFSLSSTAPTMPANYDRKRVIGFLIRSAGVNSAPISLTGSISLAVSAAFTSGTSIDFTGIPSNAKRVTMLMAGVTFSGAASPEVRLGTAGGIVATGYVADVVGVANGTGQSSSTTGHLAVQDIANGTYSGHVIFERLAGNTWVGIGQTRYASKAISFHNSTIALSAPLSQLRLTTQAGTATGTAGTVTISWEV